MYCEDSRKLSPSPPLAFVEGTKKKEHLVGVQAWRQGLERAGSSLLRSLIQREYRIPTPESVQSPACL